MGIKMSEIIFKSEVSPRYKKYGYVSFFFGIGVVFFYLAPIINNLLGLRNPHFSTTPSNLPFLIELPIFLIEICIPVLLFWLAFQFRRSFLFIYTNGIKISKPCRFLRLKFYSWDSIKEIKLYQKEEIRKHNEYYSAIYFFLKNNPKSIRITEFWVNKLQDAYDIMKKYMEPELFKEQESCKFHPKFEISQQCRTCGAYVCEACIEKREFVDPESGHGRYYVNCSICNYKVGIKRMSIIYSISLIIPVIAFILLFLNLFFDMYDYLFGVIHVYQTSFALRIEFSFNDNIIGIFTLPYAIISVFYTFSVIPYAFAFFIGNIKRAKNFDRLNIIYNRNELRTLTFFTILIASYYSIWYFYLHIAWFVSYLIWMLIFTPIYLIFEYPTNTRAVRMIFNEYFCPNCNKKLYIDLDYCPRCETYLRR